MFIFNFCYWLLYFSFNPSNDYDYNYDDNDDNIMMIIITIIIIMTIIIIIILIIIIIIIIRGTRSKRRAANISDIDITSESAQARI